MITKDTAARIFSAYREIEAAEGLLKGIDEGAKDTSALNYRDSFGQARGLELGVPSGSGHRVYNVNPILGAAVLRAHVEKKRAEIAELCEVARLELDRDF